MNTWIAPKKSYRYIVTHRDKNGTVISVERFEYQPQLVEYMRRIIQQGIREGLTLTSRGVERKILFEEYEWKGNKRVQWLVEGMEE